MNREDKQRIIGKIVSINSDRFTVELLTGIDNFNVNGFDDIHYFAQLNSYVIIPYQDYYIVAEIYGVREKDINTYSSPQEQFLNKVHSGKFLDVLPIGSLKKDENNENDTFEFGASVYPSLYTDVLYIKEQELNIIFNSDAEKYTSGEPRIHNTLSIGKSTIFPDYSIKINIDKFFGGHSAILGNTGSGKSCTISSILQGIYNLENYKAFGSTFIIFDVNGEYEQAFSHLKDQSISTKYYTLDEKKEENTEKFVLPSWYLNIEEWALLLQASEKTQLPILRNALGFASIFSNQDSKKDEIRKIKNHILSTCITEILRDSTGTTSQSSRIKSIIKKYYTRDINVNTKFSNTSTISQALDIDFGRIVEKDSLEEFLKQFFLKDFEIPTYKKENPFDFNSIDEAVELAILYEEAHGNRQIRDYCSSLITRIKSLKDRKDYNFIKSGQSDIKKFKRDFLGLELVKNNSDSHLIKNNQLTILDLSSVENEIVEIISCVLSRIIYETIKEFEPRNEFPVNLILEEAHRYISNNSQRNFLKTNQIFETIAKEGRKFGMFLMISSQRPSELSKTVISQCSNFIVHRIQNPEDLSHIRQITPHISETILKRMPSIPRQQALIFGHAINLPTTFKVNDANPKPKSDDNKISENWFTVKNKDFIIEHNKKL